MLLLTAIVLHFALDCGTAGLKRGAVARDSNSNAISPVAACEHEDDDELASATGQAESYHWEEDDLTSSEATSTDKTLGSSGEAHSAEEYAEIAKKVDTNLAHIDMEDFKSADLFQTEQIRSLLIEYNRAISRSQSPLSQDDCSLTDCGSLCKSGPLFSPQRVVAAKGANSAPDYSTDSLNLVERDECWLLDEAGASQLLCRTNMTNYTLAWSSSGTDQDYNEPGTSSSGSEQSHWSSSGSGGRVAPPIPPWPAATRQQLQCWVTQPAKKTPDDVGKELISFVKMEDNLCDMDNGNAKANKKRPVFTKTDAATPPASSAMSLLQIYMRQRSQTSIERENKKIEDVIASGGGEGWVEDYPSSADEKLGLESISSSLVDEEDDDEDEDDDDDDDCHDNRSLTLTDVSDIEQTSIQIDAIPFNATAASSSLDKLIAKIKPFELGLSPASIEEHWNFESRLRRPDAGLMDKSCQVAINTATSATQEESTSTDPVKPQAYMIFPSYSLPDLSFLKKHDYTWIGDVLLSPQNMPAARKPEPTRRTFDDLKRRQMSHVKDWESLKILLPEEIREQINTIKPTPSARANRPRPKSCENTVVLRNSKKTTRPGSSNWADGLPTVPQSPPGGPPPPLPKRTASLPHSSVANRQFNRRCAGPAVTRRPLPENKPSFGYTMRKTVSFGEHLASGGFLKMANQKRPLSLSHWSQGGSLDIDSTDEDVAVNVNIEQKRGLVRGVSLAAAQLCKIMSQTSNDEAVHAKLVARCLTGQLSPAIYQLLSDGLLPNVNTFFGQVNNSVWRVVEASVKKGPVLPWIEELVFCLNSEESLPEGPVRFGVFITELVNMGGLDWWLDNLSTKETILRRHYSPNGFLYLCHTTTRPLMEEVQASLRPLVSLPFDNTLPLPTKQAPKPVTTPVVSPSKPTSPSKTILKSPTRSKTQRPLSYVQNSPSKTSPKPQYRRTQSQHSGLSPAKRSPPPQQNETKVEEFSSLKQKWESLCNESAPGNKAVIPAPAAAIGDNSSAAKSRIPRPVFRFNK